MDWWSRAYFNTPFPFGFESLIYPNPSFGEMSGCIKFKIPPIRSIRFRIEWRTCYI